MARQGDEPGGGSKPEPGRVRYSKPFRFQILKGGDDSTGMVDVLLQERVVVLRIDDRMREWVVKEPFPIKLPEEILWRGREAWEEDEGENGEEEEG